jgi:hypothetical protein
LVRLGVIGLYMKCSMYHSLEVHFSSSSLKRFLQHCMLAFTHACIALLDAALTTRPDSCSAVQGLQSVYSMHRDTVYLF